MAKKFPKALQLGLLLILAVTLVSGCATLKKWTGSDSGDDLDAEMVPPESQQETVMIDGKAYVRSKNPYWMMVADQPEYLYVEKGTEFVGAQQHLINSLVKAVGAQQQKAAGKAIPPDKLQEMVRAEVDRILREQGLGGFVSQTKGGASAAVVGRAVAVIPDLDTPASAAGLNRTLGTALGEALSRTKDLRVSTPSQVDGALRQAGVADQKTISSKIKVLGDALAVQGIVLTGVMPSQGGSQGAIILEVYDAFTGLKEDSLVSAPSAGLSPETVTKFAQNNVLRISGDLAKIPWFGRVEFVKENMVYLNLGQNSGLKVGDRLKVVEPGKEVVNPKTQKVLGYTADVPQGEIKVTELLSSTAAVAQTMSGGPFKANDKVKAAN